ncbi:MAG TPA: sialidase family protein, partial [Aestuariivirgaceae bacterium]|nr:sialidase family protein [Aestuariivirgaceae bacterium]
MQKLFVWGFTIALAPALSSVAMSEDAPVVSLNEVTAHTHIHGLAVERNSGANLLVATHHGLFRVDDKGSARLISPVQDFMGFSPHPQDASVLFASGHPPSGGNLGYIRSDDGGVSWRQVSPGADGDTADFHQMTVALSEPNIVFGSYRGRLQASSDGGANFAVVGPSPDGLIALTSRSFTELYAATEFGLLESADGGKSWRTLIKDAPIATVLATA